MTTQMNPSETAQAIISALPGLKVVLAAMTEACQGLISELGHHLGHRDEWNPVGMALPEWAKAPNLCPCKGTGRTLIPVSEDDTEAGQVSRAEACGRLLILVAPSTIAPAGELWIRMPFIQALLDGDYPGALTALLALVRAREVQS